MWYKICQVVFIWLTSTQQHARRISSHKLWWALEFVLLIHVTTDLSLFIKWISFRFFFHVHTWVVVSTRGEVKELLCLDEMAAEATHVSAKTSRDSELHKLHLFYIKPVRLNEWADKLLRIQCEPKYTPQPPLWPYSFQLIPWTIRWQWQLVK